MRLSKYKIVLGDITAYLDSNESIKTENGDSDEAYLDLDPSVLSQRSGKTSSITDLYGLKVFDEAVEKQIEEYKLKNQQEIQFYHLNLFATSVKQEDEELEIIRQSVFAESAAFGKPVQAGSRESDLGENIVIAFLIMILILLTGISYGRFKKKGREKRLADINNSYDE